MKLKFYRMLQLSLLLTLLSSIFLFSEGLPAKRVSSISSISSIRKTHLIEIDIHRVLPPTSTVRLFCTRDRFATPSVDAAVEKGFSTQRVQAVVKKAPERNQNERRGPLSNLSNNFKSEPLVAAVSSKEVAGTMG